jgi:hypothetical protein
MFLETLAFTLVIGAQFLGAIYLLSNRSSIYGEPPAEEQAAGRTLEQLKA